MAAYARGEALEGKHVAGTEDKEHFQDFFFLTWAALGEEVGSLSCLTLL